MANPYGMTEFSTSEALGLYQAGQDRRLRQLLLQRQIEAQDREIDQKAKTAAAWAKIFQPKGGDTTSVGGAVGAYAAPPAAAAPTEGTTTTPNPTPSADPAPAGGLNINREAIPQLIALDPDDGFKLLQHLRTLDKETLELTANRNKAVATAAQHLLTIPQSQWQAEKERIIPWLREQGVDQAHIDGFQLNPENLKWAVAQARDVEKLIDDTKLTWHQQGEQPSFATYAGTGQLVNPGAVMGGGAPAGDIPTISSPEQLKALPPGTRFKAPDGSIRIVPGGASHAGSQTFP